MLKRPVRRSVLPIALGREAPMQPPETRKPTSAKVGSLEISKSLAAIDTGDNTESGITPQTKWKLANPKAIWAQHALRSALKRGLIIQEPCKECGALDAEA